VPRNAYRRIRWCHQRICEKKNWKLTISRSKILQKPAFRLKTASFSKSPELSDIWHSGKNHRASLNPALYPALLPEQEIKSKRKRFGNP
jgi:hypothetical protein